MHKFLLALALVSTNVAAIQCNSVYMPPDKVDNDCQINGPYNVYVNPYGGSIPINNYEVVKPITSTTPTTVITRDYPATYSSTDRVLVLPRVCVDITLCYRDVVVELNDIRIISVGK